MADPIVRYGWEGRLYYNSGTHDGPTWVEITPVGEVKFADPKEKIALKLRRDGRKVYAAGATDLSLSFSLLHDPENAAWVALQAAFLARSIIEIAFLDRDKESANPVGGRFPAVVTKFENDQPDNDAQMDAVEVCEGLAEYQAEAWGEA
jgi:hypothetical protein